MDEYTDVDALLGRSAIRRRILALIVAEPKTRIHLREIARMAGTSAGTASRELRRLQAAGLIVRATEGRQVYHQARRESPLIGPLRELLRVGPRSGEQPGRPDPIGLEMARRLSAELPAIYGQRLRGVYLCGSRARGDHRRDSDVDIVIVLDTVGDYGGDLRRSSELASRLSLEQGLSISRTLVPEASWAAGDRPFVRAAAADAIAA